MFNFSDIASPRTHREHRFQQFRYSCAYLLLWKLGENRIERTGSRTVLFPSNSCRFWLHNPGFQQMLVLLHLWLCVAMFSLLFRLGVGRLLHKVLSLAFRCLRTRAFVLRSQGLVDIFLPSRSCCFRPLSLIPFLHLDSAQRLFSTVGPIGVPRTTMFLVLFCELRYLTAGSWSRVSVVLSCDNFYCGLLFRNTAFNNSCTVVCIPVAEGTCREPHRKHRGTCCYHAFPLQ
jgi:hypothetical protein